MSVTLTSTVRDEAVNHKSQVVQLKSSSCLLRLVILTGLSVFWEELFLFLFHQTVREKESKHINIMHQHILSDFPPKNICDLVFAFIAIEAFLIHAFNFTRGPYYNEEVQRRPNQRF